MIPVFDPRAFDARAFFAPRDETTVEPPPGIRASVEDLSPVAGVVDLNPTAEPS